MNNTANRSAAEAPPAPHRRRWPRRLAIFAAVVATITAGGCAMFAMPGDSYEGPLPPLTDAQSDLADQLSRDVYVLAADIGERHIHKPDLYAAAARYIDRRFTELGYFVERQPYDVDGVECVNLIAERRGGASGSQIVVIGAHYDSVPGTVGADDNASAVAALLALAQHFAAPSPAPNRTIRFVAFANEEPPYFHTELMGSLVYARMCKQRGDDVSAMLALDGVGYYSDEPDTQHYPPPMNPIYPSTADFIGFVGDFGSLSLVKRCVGSFREHAQFPSEGGVGPGFMAGVYWSDHWSFRQVGYPAIMVSDSLPFRYAHYHQSSDTPDRLDYARMARVVEGLAGVVTDLAND